MQLHAFMYLALTMICLYMWMAPTNIDAFPVQHKNRKRCSVPCNLYCVCGNQIDEQNCPKCACRPSNSCTGRRPNAYGRPRFVKSQILY